MENSDVYGSLVKATKDSYKSKRPFHINCDPSQYIKSWAADSASLPCRIRSPPFSPAHFPLIGPGQTCDPSRPVSEGFSEGFRKGLNHGNKFLGGKADDECQANTAKPSVRNRIPGKCKFMQSHVCIVLWDAVHACCITLSVG